MSSKMNKQTTNILVHLTEYGFITSEQCASIYYKSNSQSLTLAQRKLKKLYDYGLIQRYKNKLTDKFVYTIDKKTTVSQHDMMIMDLYSYIFKRYKVEYFKKEFSWKETKRRSDAHIIFERNGMLVTLLVEIDLYHKTSQKKLDDLFNYGEVHQWYKDRYGEDVYPDILIINATGYTNLKSDEYNVICINYDFKGIEDVL